MSRPNVQCRSAEKSKALVCADIQILASSIYWVSYTQLANERREYGRLGFYSSALEGATSILPIFHLLKLSHKPLPTAGAAGQLFWA